MGRGRLPSPPSHTKPKLRDVVTRYEPFSKVVRNMRMTVKIPRLSHKKINKCSVNSGECAQVPSADKSFLVKLGCASLRTCREIRLEKSRFPHIPFCESLVPDVESPILGLADIQVTNNRGQCRENKTWSFTQVPQYQVGFDMNVDNHQDAFTRSESHCLITPMASGHVRDNRTVFA